VRKTDMNEINLIIFNARNEHDRTKFCEDLKEAILEINEMEGLRIQSEVEKLRSSLVDITNNNGVVSSLIDYPINKRDRPLSRTLSNSLLDMALSHQPLPCRTSQCSLDSGMVNK
jgi:IQ motif/SEC7 domain-containing protein